MHRILAGLFFLLLLAPAARATWSILLVDQRTGEVAIGSATCLTGYDLRQLASVVVVGRGAAAAQSYVDTTGRNRVLIRDQLVLGTPPAQILALLAAQDPQHQTRQYGIVDAQGRSLAFTGTGAGAWAGHLTGRFGTVSYAIQGNVLTGAPVLQLAELALLDSAGDLAEKLMAAMAAARLMGGDGRCSCPQGVPTGCGAPPASFAKSAHIGYMVVARQGDLDGSCGSGGCATGSYYLNLNVAGQSSAAPDPVLQLQALFASWRASWTGRPDHHLSTVVLEPPTLPADGRTQATATVTLRDWRGLALGAGGARVALGLDPASTAGVGLGPVADLGNGAYRFTVTAGAAPGIALLRISVDDGKGAVLLSPRTELALGGDPLWASRRELSAAAGGPVDFVLRSSPALSGRWYVLLASASGSAPGLYLSPGATLPLNPDPVFSLFLDLQGSPLLKGSPGLLDPAGSAAATFRAPAGALSFLVNRNLTFAWATLVPFDFASGPAVVSIRP